MPLSEQSRAKLDGIVQQMTANKESDENIQTVVNDFKQKYGSQDAFQQAVNYKTGTVLDAPLGLVQGVAKGAASTGVGIGSLFRKAAGMAPLPADTFQADTEAHGAAENIGKFVEQGAEFAIPGSGVAKATKGAGLLLRAGTQAATAGGIGAAQSGGQLAPTLTSAVLGGVGPLAGAGAKGIAQLAAKRAPTLANYAESFAATPKQTQKLNSALDLLKQDGIQPGANIHEMQGAIENRLSTLGKQYEALKASGAGSTPTDAQGVLQGLEDYAKSLKTDGVLLSGNKAKYSLVREQMRDVKRLAEQNNGQLTFDQLKELRNIVNEKTGFASADWEKGLYGKLGNIYRSHMDQAVPGTAELNRSWAKYSDLAGEIEKNIAQNKGQGTSALGKMFEASEMKHTGAVIGGTLGAAVGGAPGAFVGSMAGRMILPKAAGTAGRMLENAVDAGAFQKLSPATQRVAAMAARMGDTKALARLLGTGTVQESAQRMTRSNQ
jgi:hypothetical protein